MATRNLFVGFIVSLLISVPLFAQTDSANRDVTTIFPRFSANLELGFVALLSHKIQFGRDTTYFDYVKNGGQDNLYPLLRLDVTGERSNGDRFRFLYQPLEIETRVTLSKETNIDGTVFKQGEPVRALYSFPFYRGSYFWKLTDSDTFHALLGGGLQIRNARVEFESESSGGFVSNRDIGPVPLLSLWLDWRLTPTSSIEFEAEGLAAPGRFINGSSKNSVQGGILDTSLRYGWKLSRAGTLFLNLRYLGGGAEGASDENNKQDDDFSKNWIHLTTTSLGFRTSL